MRRILLSVCLVCAIVLESLTKVKPLAGKPYTLTYNPLTAGILLDAKQIWAVYVFDFWGTKVVQRHRGEGPQEDMFQNVLMPDEGRAKKVKMLRSGRQWKAEIMIPPDVALLSCYFTDSSRMDANNRKTFVSFVCDEKGKPVRGARFRNVDFLIMAGKGVPAILQNIKREIKDYPDYLLAHLVYWRFRFYETISPDTLSSLMAESERHFARLQRQYGDTVLNYKALSFDEINSIIKLSLHDRATDPRVVQLAMQVNSNILKTIEAIPPTRRLQSMAHLQLVAQESRLGPAERERRANEEIKKMLAQFVDLPAPDFAFETIDGSKHRLSDYRGSYVLLEFWGTWCTPCVQEIPNLVQTYKSFHGRGLVMISVSNDLSARKQDREKFAEFTKNHGMNWTVALDDSTTTIHKLYDIRFWPNMFLIGPDGKVLQRNDLRGEGLKKTLSAILPK